MPEPQKPKHGVFCWNELVSRDPAVAEEFYAKVLGWKAADSGVPGTKYTLFSAGDTQVGGLMEMPKEIPSQVPSHWMSYVAVDDVDASAAKVTEHGGKILHGPQDIPNVGRFCIIQDPTGAVVSLITMEG